MTGCSVREPDRAGLARRYPGGRPVPAARRGAGARRPARAGLGAGAGRARRRRDDRRRAGRSSGAADHLAGDARRGRRRRRGRARVGDQRLAADHLRLRQDLHLLHRAVQPRAGAEPAVRRDRRRGARAGRRRLPRGDAARPERQLVRPRPAARAALRRTSTRERWAGRRLDLDGRPDLAELIRAIDGLRTADGVPAIPRLRFVTSHPWDLSDRLIAAMAECPSVCEHLHLPVQSGDDAVLRRMGRQYTIEHYLERLARIRAAVPGIAISTDVIVGFCGETEAAVRGDAAAARDGPLRPGLRGRLLASGPARRRRASPTTCPPPRSARRLNELLALQEGIGLERNRAWLGRTTEVLVDTVVPPRSHDHEDDEADGRAERATPCRPADGRAPPAAPARTSSSTSTGAPELVGRSWPSASTTPARTRSAASLARRRARRPLAAAPRHRRRRRRPARPGSRSSSPSGSIADGPPAEIISADSRQVYRGLDIGTAKVDAPRSARGSPHHGLDLVDPDEPFTRRRLRAHAARRAGRRSAARGGDRDPRRRDRPVPARGRRGPRHRRAARGPAVRARLEARARRRTASSRSSDRLRAAGARASRPRRSTCATRGASCAPSRSPTLAGDAPLPGRRGYAGPGRVARARPRAGRARELDRGARTGAVRRAASSRRRAPCASGSTRACPPSRRSATARLGGARRRGRRSRRRSRSTPSATWPVRASASGPGSGASPTRSRSLDAADPTRAGRDRHASTRRSIDRLRARTPGRYPATP